MGAGDDVNMFFFFLQLIKCYPHHVVQSQSNFNNQVTNSHVYSNKIYTSNSTVIRC